jgi:hypothetical protein
MKAGKMNKHPVMFSRISSQRTGLRGVELAGDDVVAVKVLSLPSRFDKRQCFPTCGDHIEYTKIDA